MKFQVHRMKTKEVCSSCGKQAIGRFKSLYTCGRTDCNLEIIYFVSGQKHTI